MNDSVEAEEGVIVTPDSDMSYSGTTGGECGMEEAQSSLQSSGITDA